MVDDRTLLKYCQACQRAYSPAKWKLNGYSMCLYMFSMEKKKAYRKENQRRDTYCYHHYDFFIYFRLPALLWQPPATGMGCHLDRTSDTLSLENGPWLERPHKAYIR